MTVQLRPYSVWRRSLLCRDRVWIELRAVQLILRLGHLATHERARETFNLDCRHPFLWNTTFCRQFQSPFLEIDSFSWINSQVILKESIVNKLQSYYGSWTFIFAEIVCGSITFLPLMDQCWRSPPCFRIAADFTRAFNTESICRRFPDSVRGLLVNSGKECYFRKIVQTTMIREKQHGPNIELNRIEVTRGNGWDWTW